MNARSADIGEHRVRIFEGSDDVARSEILSEFPDTVVIDGRDHFRGELNKLQPPLDRETISTTGCWIHYPWRRALVHLPGPDEFRRLRSDRNRNKITLAEQEEFHRLAIGVVGLSVGHTISHTLALEGLCGELRLADFDSIELSNLNRIPATVFDIGVNKAVVAARRIAELDPYLKVVVLTEGLTEENMAAFFDGLDLVIEECDSLDMKVRVREEAKRRGIPLLMETSDRGLFDVERYDREPDRPMFHGLLGDVHPTELKDLATRDKAPHVMRILEAGELSARMAASMVEIDRTVSTWPQLGGDISLGAAMVATAVRRFGRGDDLPSGRIRVDLEKSFDLLDPSIPERPVGLPDLPLTDLTAEIPGDALDAVVHAIRLAPSGGNVQPWSITATDDSVGISMVRDRSSAMDHLFRGTYVAIGAAAFNARVAAAHHGRLATVVPLPHGDGSDLVVDIELGEGGDPSLAVHYGAMVRRISNRSTGTREPLSDDLRAALSAAAAAEGAELRLVEDAAVLARLADTLAESDRARYLTPLLHSQMMSELKWPGRDRLDLGIDVRTLDLDDTDLAKMQVAARPEVMRHLADWEAGQALGDNTRDRVNASSALAVVTVNGDSAVDYVRGGSAAERVWIAAEEAGLGVQPMSPVFLFARGDADLETISAPFAPELAKLQATFAELSGLGEQDTAILVMRLSHHPGTAVRSERLSLGDVLQT